MSYAHISGVVQVTTAQGPEGPVDPGWGQTPPTDPGYGRPDWGGGQIDNSLPGGGGHVWGTLIRWLQRPEIGNGLPKPPGLRPVLPPSIDNGLPPNGGAPPHPWLPGSWQPIDPGFGKPPLWGWVGIDNGLPTPPVHIGGGPVVPPVHIGGGPSTPPGLHPGGGPSTPPPTHKPTPPGQGGDWYPTDPGFGVPVRPCPPVGGKPHPPIWAWVPDRPPVEGGEGGATTVTLYPTTVSAPAAGGSGSVNVTLASAGTWEVDATSVPTWVTVTPMGPQTTDQNILFTVSANSTGMTRQGVIKVSGATLTINQAAV